MGGLCCRYNTYIEINLLSISKYHANFWCDDAMNFENLTMLVSLIRFLWNLYNSDLHIVNLKIKKKDVKLVKMYEEKPSNIHDGKHIFQISLHLNTTVGKTTTQPTRQTDGHDKFLGPKSC